MLRWAWDNTVMSVYDRLHRWWLRPYLTDAGWPRPRINGWSIPWDAPHHRLGQVHPERIEQAHDEVLCTVCGLEHDDLVWFFVDEPLPDNPDDYYALPKSDELMHEKCALFSLSVCPHLKTKHPLYLYCVSIERVELVEVGEDEPTFDLSGRHYRAPANAIVFAARK